MNQFWENLQTDRRTDGWNLFYRTLPTKAGGPILWFKNQWIDFCIAHSLTGFYMVQAFTKKNYWKNFCITKHSAWGNFDKQLLESLQIVSQQIDSYNMCSFKNESVFLGTYNNMWQVLCYEVCYTLILF